jgi:hypothetical protein
MQINGWIRIVHFSVALIPFSKIIWINNGTRCKYNDYYIFGIRIARIESEL